MKPEAQRIAIAEHCGWDVWNDAEEIPDYLKDLNAMAYAEITLTDEQDHDYSDELERVVGGRFTSNNALDMRRLRSATAAQRAEAFLKALGKWTDSPATP